MRKLRQIKYVAFSQYNIHDPSKSIDDKKQPFDLWTKRIQMNAPTAERAFVSNTFLWQQSAISVHPEPLSSKYEKATGG